MNQQNLGRGIAVVLVTAALCVLPYALIVKALSTNFAYLSIGIGLAVGYAAHKVGKASGIAVGAVAAVATFAASLLADCLAIKWIVSDKYGIDVTLSDARRGVRPMSYLIFAIGAFVAFGAAGGRRELQERSAATGAGRFTPDTMNAPAVPPTAPPQTWATAVPPQTWATATPPQTWATATPPQTWATDAPVSAPPVDPARNLSAPTPDSPTPPSHTP